MLGAAGADHELPDAEGRVGGAGRCLRGKPLVKGVMCVHDHVHAVLFRERDQRLLSLQHFAALPDVPRPPRRFRIHEGDPRHAEFLRRADQGLVIRAGRERDETDPIRVGPRQIQGGGADRAGGSQKRDAPHLRKTSQIRK